MSIHETTSGNAGFLRVVEDDGERVEPVSGMDVVKEIIALLDERMPLVDRDDPDRDLLMVAHDVLRSRSLRPSA